MENEKNTEQINGAEKDQTDQTQATAQEQPPAEKTFTQEEVNRIVQERLARVKNSSDQNSLAEREQALTQKEMRLDAREKLADAGLPKDLLPLVDCSSKKNMDDSIALIGKYFGVEKAREGFRVSMSTRAASNGSSSGGDRGDSPESIRAAMGLKGKNR